MCMKCGALSAFNADLSLRELTMEELFKIKASPDWAEVERHRQALKHVWQMKPESK